MFSFKLRYAVFSTKLKELRVKSMADLLDRFVTPNFFAALVMLFGDKMTGLRKG